MILGKASGSFGTEVSNKTVSIGKDTGINSNINIKKSFYLFVSASFKSNSINLIKLIFLNAAISGTKESFVIPG